MATTTIPWGDGSGENIYLTYSSASGNQTVQVTSDANTGAARSKIVNFATGNIIRQLTVNQEAGISPGDISRYVQSGLILHMDGIEKGNVTDVWKSYVGDYQFANHGATFNTDHVLFDGSDDYLDNSDFEPPSVAVGTIEVCYSSDDITTTRLLFYPKNIAAAIAMGYYSSRWIWRYNSNGRRYIPLNAFGTTSVNNSRGISNGSAMSASGNDYWGGAGSASSVNRIGSHVNKSFFKGKIYSIRIYNRQLTQAEILSNQAVDNARFNLGLNL